jgi:streptogramin lyase/4-amino-4-deoxy-L-arabinose transferase-like glycosyltransferase
MNNVTRSNVPRIRNFGYGVAAVFLALMAQSRLRGDSFTAAIVLYGAALGLFLYAAHRSAALASPQSPCTVGMGQSIGRSWWWRILPVALGLGLAILALRQFHANIELPTLTTWRLYTGSVGLCLISALLLDWGGKRKIYDLRSTILDSSAASEEARATNIPHAAFPIHHLLVLFLIFAVAAFMRLWHFASLPFGVWYDEAENALQTMRFLNTSGVWPIIGGSIRPPAHYLFLIALAFRSFGVSVYSVRAVSVALGLLMVLAGYLIGRELFGRAMGFVLAFLLAISSWAVNVSRFGMYNVSTPLFALLTMGFLLRGIRRGRYVDFALAGLSFGLGFCIYAAFQLFVGVVLLFLLAMSLFERGFLRRTWSGVLLMIVVALLVAAPMLLFARDKPEIYFARTKETSLFSNKQPAERWPALIENVRKHLLMYNYRGDPNGRHNLPGAPMLDSATGALMVLGLGLALWRWRRPRYLLLPIWLGVMLLGGILSLDFEAPQSLRAIGTLPIAYILATIPLHELWQMWRRDGGRYYPNFVVIPLVVLLLGVGYNNFYMYFYRQTLDFAVWNAYSTPETITAKLLAGFDDQTEAYVISYFQGHPTLNFLARNAHPYHRLETTDQLPLPWPPDKHVALILNADSRALFDEAKRFYPHATFQEFQPPFGGPTVVYYALLKPEDIVSVQGLTGKYYANSQWKDEPAQVHQDPTLGFDWRANPPLAQPFSVEWEGVLNVATYGAHQFFLQAPGYAELYIGEQRVLTGTGELTGGLVLAQGNHALRVRAVGAPGPFSLSWRPPDRAPELIPASALYVPPIASNGLLGNYFPNNQWREPVALARIDSQLNLYFHVTPLPRPYTVEWTGKIAIPQSGSYRFGLESIDESTLFIDNQAVTAGRFPNVYQENGLDLEKGLHDIRIRFSDSTDHTHINLYWTPPGGAQQIIPAGVLFPPQGNYERVQLPDLAALSFNPTKPSAPVQAEKTLPGLVRLVQQGLNQPRGIAAGLDGRIYVADTGNQRVLILSPKGDILKEFEGGSEPFAEPFDIAVDAQNHVYVLDATLGRLAVFDADGGYQRDIPAEKSLLEHTRGLSVDRTGRIWVANTAGGRVVALDEKGVVLINIPIWPGGDAQPVDVTVGNDGTIFVTDSGLNKLVSFGLDNRRLLAWDIPVANSLDGAHLATGADGFLYMSEPEKSHIVKLTPHGERVGSWAVIGANGALSKPIGVTVDPTGRIWCVDVAGGAVFVIEPNL